MTRTIIYNVRGVAHIYQRGLNMSVIFYSTKDILVFYTILFRLKKKYNITVFGVVCMYNHYHLLITSSSQAVISRFMCELEATYSREFNKDAGIKGHVFEPVYGLSNKIGNKKQKDAASYLYNNPVEKQLSARAIEYRWNFLAYAISDHPFSEKLVIRKSSRQMRQCIQEVNCVFKLGHHINHAFLRKWFACLSEKEINQLIDYIITKYKVVDYEKTLHLYKSFEDMLLAFDSTTGSEHDLKEEYSDKSYRAYNSLLSSLSREYGFNNPKDVLRLSPENRRDLCEILIKEQSVSRFIAETLLHIYVPKVKHK